MSTAPEQLALFDVAPDYWRRLCEAKERVMRSAKAQNTVKAYAHAWKVFSAWCAAVRSDSYPASSETVSDFVVWSLYEKKYRLDTVKITLTAIGARHAADGLPSPVTPAVRELVRHAARDLKERPAGKEALTPSQLRRLSRKLSDGSPISTRDRALFLLQFAAGWRCSEVAGLELADVRFTRSGFVLTLGASKGDQDGREGRIVGIPRGSHALTCPVEALRAWLEVRGRWPGPLFCRLDPRGHVVECGFLGDTINERLKLALAKIGVDPAAYGSHSLRAGMVTAGIARGSSESLIMLRTGHKSLVTMRRYVRIGQAFHRDPLAGVL
jgi:integrase